MTAKQPTKAQMAALAAQKAAQEKADAAKAGLAKPDAAPPKDRAPAAAQTGAPDEPETLSPEAQKEAERRQADKDAADLVDAMTAHDKDRVRMLNKKGREAVSAVEAFLRFENGPELEEEVDAVKSMFETKVSLAVRRVEQQALAAHRGETSPA